MTMRNLPALHGDVATVIGHILPRLARGARPVGPLRWHIPLPDRDIASVWLDGEWLCVESEAGPADDWDLLRRNAALPGPLKLARRSGRPVLCAEVRIDAETAAGVTRALLADLRAAHAGAGSKRAATQTPEARASATSRSRESAAALAELIVQAGWEPLVRGDTCSVAIAAREVRYEVTLDMLDGSLREIAGEIEMARLGALDAVAQAALARLLVFLCGRLRGVRARILDDSAGAWRLIAEARSPLCSEVGITTVIESLTAACVFFGREVVALAHDSGLADAYLCTVCAAVPSREPLTHTAA